MVSLCLVFLVRYVMYVYQIYHMYCCFDGFLIHSSFENEKTGRGWFGKLLHVHLQGRCYLPCEAFANGWFNHQQFLLVENWSDKLNLCFYSPISYINGNFSRLFVGLKSWWQWCGMSFMTLHESHDIYSLSGSRRSRHRWITLKFGM